MLRHKHREDIRLETEYGIDPGVVDASRKKNTTKEDEWGARVGYGGGVKKKVKLRQGIGLY